MAIISIGASGEATYKGRQPVKPRINRGYILKVASDLTGRPVGMAPKYIDTPEKLELHKQAREMFGLQPKYETPYEEETKFRYGYPQRPLIGYKPTKEEYTDEFAQSIQDVFPDFPISSILKAYELAPDAWLKKLQTGGKTDTKVKLIHAMFPGASDDDISTFFGEVKQPQVPIEESVEKTIPERMVETLGKAPLMEEFVAPVAEKVGEVVGKAYETMTSPQVMDWINYGAQTAAGLLSPIYAFEKGKMKPEVQQIYLNKAREIEQEYGSLDSPIELFSAMWDLGSLYRAGGEMREMYEEEVPLPARMAAEIAIETPAIIATGGALGATKWGANLPKIAKWFLNIPSKPKISPAELKLDEILTDFTDAETTWNTLKSQETLKLFSKHKTTRPLAKMIEGVIAEASDETPEKAAIAVMDALLFQADLKSTVAMSLLRKFGTDIKLFVADAKGVIQSGNLKGVTVQQVLEHRAKYLPSLNPIQRSALKEYDRLNAVIVRFLKRNGEDIELLTPEEGGKYAQRVVVGWRNPITKQIEKTATVGRGGGKPGTKHRVFANIDDAYKEGYEYMLPWDALEYRMGQALRYVAKKKAFVGFLGKRIGLRTTAAPQEYKLGANNAKIRFDKAMKAQTLVNLLAKKRGGEPFATTVKSIDNEFPELKLGEIIKRLRRLKPRIPKVGKIIPETAPEVKPEGRPPVTKVTPGVTTVTEGVTSTRDKVISRLKTDVAKLVLNTKTENAKAQYHLRVARQVAMTKSMLEAQPSIKLAPFFSGKYFTGPRAHIIADTINRELDPKFLYSLQGINKINEVGRYMVLAGDASPFAIQLIFMGGAFPVQFGKAIGGFWKAVHDETYLDRYIANPVNYRTMQKHLGLIITRHGSEMTEAMLKGGLLASQPLKYPAKSLIPAQRGFDTALTVAGIEMAKALDHLATTPAAIAQIDAFLNDFRGLMSTQKMGIAAMQRQAETAGLLAPQYNRAIAALLFDIFRGGLRGNLAREALGRGVTAISAMTIATSLMMGESEEEAIMHLSPVKLKGNKWVMNDEFMTWNIAGQSVGPGSKVRSLIKLWAQLAINPESAIKEGMNNPFLRFTRANAAPAISSAIDIITGKDYVGDPTRDGMLQLAETIFPENLLPVWVQSIVLEGGGALGRLTRGVAEFAGMRGYTMIPSKVLEVARDQKADMIYGKKWYQLAINEKANLEKLYPELILLNEQASNDWAQRNDLDEGVTIDADSQRYNQDYTEGMYAMVKALEDGKITTTTITDKDHWSKLANDRSVLFDELRKKHTDYYKELLDKRPDINRTFDTAWYEYIDKILSVDWEDKVTFSFKFEERDKAINEFITKWGDKIYNEIVDMRQSNIDVPPLYLEFQDAKEKWTPYYDKEESTDRIRVRRVSPEIEANLFFWGRVSAFENPNTVKLVLDMMDKWDIPYQSIRAFNDDPQKYLRAVRFKDNMDNQTLARLLLSKGAFNEFYLNKKTGLPAFEWKE